MNEGIIGTTARLVGKGIKKTAGFATHLLTKNSVNSLLAHHHAELAKDALKNQNPAKAAAHLVAAKHHATEGKLSDKFHETLKPMAREVKKSHVTNDDLTPHLNGIIRNYKSTPKASLSHHVMQHAAKVLIKNHPGFAVSEDTGAVGLGGTVGALGSIPSPALGMDDEGESDKPYYDEDGNLISPMKAILMLTNNQEL